MWYVSGNSPMTDPQSRKIPLIEHDFDGLTHHTVGTAGTHVPLVILYDDIPRGEMREALLHRDFLSLYIARQGRATHVIDGVPFAVSRGDVYIMGVGATHRFTNCHDLLTDSLHFSPRFFDWDTMQALSMTPGFKALFVERRIALQDMGGCSSGRWLHLSPDALSRVQSIVDELRREYSRNTPDGVLMTRATFVRLLVTLSRLYEREGLTEPSTPSARPHENTVGMIVGYIDTHFMEPLRVDELASTANLSADRFTEVFASIMGRTPKEYIRHLRVERAKTLLGTTEATVAAVGLESGIGDAAYFTKVFRASTGLTPSEYRRQTVANRIF